MTTVEDFQKEVKILVLGNKGVGKSSIIQTLCDRGCRPHLQSSTANLDYAEKLLSLDPPDGHVKVMIWDPSSNERSSYLSRTMHEGPCCAMLVFSTTDRASFEDIHRWHERFTSLHKNGVVVLVQSKVDLIDQAVVTSKEAEALAESLGICFYMTSTVELLNVKEVFLYLAQTVLSTTRKLQTTSVATSISHSRETGRQSHPPSSTKIDLMGKLPRRNTKGGNCNIS